LPDGCFGQCSWIVPHSKRLSYEQASEIIGTHFPEISDRLLNVLQLQRQLEHSESADLSLLHASIDERTETLRTVPFKKAVNWQESTRLMRYAIPPVASCHCVVLLETPVGARSPLNEFYRIAKTSFRPRRLPSKFSINAWMFLLRKNLPSMPKQSGRGAERCCARKQWTAVSNGAFFNGIYSHTFPIVREDIPFCAGGRRGEVSRVCHTGASCSCIACPPRFCSRRLRTPVCLLKP
jgi:hypothetical protein